MENTKVYSQGVDSIKKVNEIIFKQNPENVMKQVESIMLSYEAHMKPKKLEKARNEVYDLIANFYSGVDTKFYIYEHNNTPVAFCVYENESESSKAWKMAVVCTDRNHQNNGYAQQLLIESFKDLRRDGQEFVVLVVRNNNHSSASVQQNLLKQCKGYTDDLYDEYDGREVPARTKYTFELESLDKTLTADSSEEITK